MAAQTSAESNLDTEEYALSAYAQQLVEMESKQQVMNYAMMGT